MGKKWLATAVEERGGHRRFNVTLRRRPFFLYPGGRHEIRNWGERLDAVYPGGRAGIMALGRRAGYEFEMNAPLSDTMDSHRLYLWAEAETGKGEELAHAISHAYFVHGRPLADRDMLCDCARELGLDAVAARAYLESDGGYDEVRKSVEHNVRLGIHSIPVFIFRSGAFESVVHGSADVRRFGEVLDAIAEAHDEL